MCARNATAGSGNHLQHPHLLDVLKIHKTSYNINAHALLSNALPIEF